MSTISAVKEMDNVQMKELFSAEAIEKQISRIGSQISERFKDQPVTLMIIANGGIYFGVDLSRAINIPVWVDVIGLSSYIGDKKCRVPEFRCPPKLPVQGRNIIIVDDVADSGETIECCMEYFAKQGALSVSSAVLMDKAVPGRAFMPTWKCFDAPNEYLIGFGLDSCEFYRNLKMVAVMENC